MCFQGTSKLGNSTTQPQGWGILKVETSFLFTRLHRNAVFILKATAELQNSRWNKGKFNQWFPCSYQLFFSPWTAVWTIGFLRLKLRLSGLVVSNFNHWTLPAGSEHHLTIDKICPHLSLSSSLPLEGPATQQDVLSKWWDTACWPESSLPTAVWCCIH